MNTAFTQCAAPRPSGRLSPLPASGRGSKTRQRGISMFIVMIILLLALILVLGGLTVTSLNESLVGNQSDAQRAYGSAQALLDAAQRDIRLNGRFCGNAAGIGGAGQNPNFTAAVTPNCMVRFPRDKADMQAMMIGTLPGMGNCVNGVCISNGPDDPRFAITQNSTTQASTAQLLAGNSGANYTQFIAVLDNNGGAGTAYGGNAQTGSGATLGAGGTYWVEVFQYKTGMVAVTGSDNMPVPANEYPFIFRITAMAQGLKGGTLSVLRTYYTPYPM